MRSRHERYLLPTRDYFQTPSAGTYRYTLVGSETDLSLALPTRFSLIELPCCYLGMQLSTWSVAKCSVSATSVLPFTVSLGWICTEHLSPQLKLELGILLPSHLNIHEQYYALFYTIMNRKWFCRLLLYQGVALTDGVLAGMLASNVYFFSFSSILVRGLLTANSLSFCSQANSPDPSRR